MRKLIRIFLLILTVAAIPFLSFSKEEAGSIRARYISLAPSTTEILFSLGLDEEIVGLSTYCNYPENAKSKTKVGDFSQPNIEKILSLRPDYIFCTGIEQAIAVSQLKKLGLKVYVADPTNMQELLDSIREIGKITGKNKEAQDLTKNMAFSIEKIKSKVSRICQEARPKVFIEIWHSPLTTAGKGSFIDDLIGIAGGINIAYDTKRPFSIFSVEEVIKRNPDCIILAYMDKENAAKIIKKRAGWQEISAVKKDRIYNDISPDLLLRPGPRVIRGLNELYKRFYPNE
jgi:iron complex transport system substrate-binding protein